MSSKRVTEATSCAAPSAAPRRTRRVVRVESATRRSFGTVDRAPASQTSGARSSVRRPRRSRMRRESGRDPKRAPAPDGRRCCPCTEKRNNFEAADQSADARPIGQVAGDAPDEQAGRARTQDAPRPAVVTSHDNAGQARAGLRYAGQGAIARTVLVEPKSGGDGLPEPLPTALRDCHHFAALRPRDRRGRAPYW